MSVRVHVEYDVPVSAIVDTETEEVERVVVWCDGIEQRDGEYAVVTTEDEKPVSQKERERAEEIVESTTWPAWDFG